MEQRLSLKVKVILILTVLFTTLSSLRENDRLIRLGVGVSDFYHEVAGLIPCTYSVLCGLSLE